MTRTEARSLLEFTIAPVTNPSLREQILQAALAYGAACARAAFNDCRRSIALARSHYRKESSS